MIAKDIKAYPILNFSFEFFVFFTPTEVQPNRHCLSEAGTFIQLFDSALLRQSRFSLPWSPLSRSARTSDRPPTQKNRSALDGGYIAPPPKTPLVINPSCLRRLISRVLSQPWLHFQAVFMKRPDIVMGQEGAILNL